jgi:hypothetical protein
VTTLSAFVMLLFCLQSIIRSYRAACQLALEKVKQLSVSLEGKSDAEKRELLIKCATTSLNSKLVGAALGMHQEGMLASNGGNQLSLMPYLLANYFKKLVNKPAMKSIRQATFKATVTIAMNARVGLLYMHKLRLLATAWATWLYILAGVTLAQDGSTCA